VRNRYLLTILLAAGGFCFGPRATVAAVVVIANQAADVVTFTIIPLEGAPGENTLRPGEVAAIPVEDDVSIVFGFDAGQRGYRAEPNSIYYFTGDRRKLDLRQIDFGAKPDENFQAAPPLRPLDAQISSGVIPVKILVDDEEPGTRKTWERRLRHRVEMASRILQRHCRMRLEVVATGTWQSNDEIADLQLALLDFERKVAPSPGMLAIGFTQQFRLLPSDFAISGGLRAPLHTHMLIPDPTGRRQADDPLKMLLHELGHFLGASHSHAPESLMRLQLGQPSPTERSAILAFDPVNVLVMNLFAEEVRTRGVRRPTELSLATKKLTGKLYSAIAEVLPKDPTATTAVDVNLVSEPWEVSEDLTFAGPRLAEDARLVMEAVVRAAENNGEQLKGDELTGLYFNQAAAAVENLPPERAAEAFLVGLAVAVDTSDLLRSSLLLRDLPGAVEFDAEREHRREIIGRPTMRGRHDVALHFLMSAASTVLMGPPAAEVDAVRKRLSDARAGSGFSFADLAVDLAGIAFAKTIRHSPASLADQVASYEVPDLVLSHEQRREGLSFDEFVRDYGTVLDRRFLAERDEIMRRLLTLPAYSTTKRPRMREISVPDFPGAYAILGAVGRDAEGHIWIGVSAEGVECPSAHLFRYDPASQKMEDCGDVVSQLRRSGQYRAREGQGMICSRIIRAADGHLYFASVGGENERIDGSRAPKWGSHLWRLQLPERRWEHLSAVPEGLVAVACDNKHLYALGYPGHVLYQYHLGSGRMESVRVGTTAGHVCRSLICDHRGHTYVPRLQAGTSENASWEAALVQFDVQLREVAETPLERYAGTVPSESRGIAADTVMGDGSIVFATHFGALYRVAEQEGRPAVVSRLPWFDSMGERTILSVTSDRSRRHLIAVSLPASERSPEWIVCDMKKEILATCPIVETGVPENLQLFGSGTIDNGETIYLGGTYARGPLSLSAAMIATLRSGGFSDRRLAQLEENATRSHQPLLFAVELTP